MNWKIFLCPRRIRYYYPELNLLGSPGGALVAVLNQNSHLA